MALMFIGPTIAGLGYLIAMLDRPSRDTSEVLGPSISPG
jgi:hypothetical protein